MTFDPRMQAREWHPSMADPGRVGIQSTVGKTRA
jgi:hypothetical protein